MKLKWFVPSALGVVSSLLVCLPVQAARLQFWRFTPDDNVLVFTTDVGVQPRAQLIPDPTRVVIDLPGIVVGSSTLSQQYGGAVREVRIGQFDAQTARIVIELSPGYTVDPQQVRVRGTTPTQWTVELPEPQRIDSSSSTASSPPPSTATPQAPFTPVAGAATRLESVRLTPDGFFIRFSGQPPEIDVDRDRDDSEVRIDLENTTLSPQLVRDQTLSSHGVNRLQIVQAETDPPVARLILHVEDTDIRWQATASNLGGLVLIPLGGARLASDDVDRQAQSTPTPAPATDEPATIQAVELSNEGDRLLVQANRSVEFESGWDRSTGAYRINIPNARLAERVPGLSLGDGSPLLNVRLREESDESVTILALPAAGVRVGGVNQPNQGLLALELSRSSQAIPVGPSGAALPNTPYTPSGQLPQANTRVVLVIDPGHGGRDPGAVGIGGLREVDVVLPVSLQVAALLEQQGVTVVMTRRSDVGLELETRVQIAEQANADLFVSIHANAISMSRPEVNGIETYYYSDAGLQLARVIHANMLQVPGTRDRGVRQARFYVIRNTSMPAVLLELGFVTGSEDIRLLTSDTYRSQMAEAIARGILQYIQ